jgi:hypothetical protein
VARSPGAHGIRPTQTGIPAFTLADAEAFLREWYGPDHPILQLVFVTSKEASEMMGDAFIGLPDTALICYAKLQGPFPSTMVTPPRGLHPEKSRPFNWQTSHAVFDAETGNALCVAFGDFAALVAYNFAHAGHDQLLKVGV